MASLGLPEVFVVFFMLIVYAFSFWVVWKFYQVLARMNDNLGGIRQAREQGAPRRPEQ